MMTDIDWWAVAAYVGLFAAVAVRGRLVWWPLSAFLLWLAANVMLLSYFHLPPARWPSYMPQLYILPAGLLFLYRCRRPGGKGRRVPAVLFAEAGAAWAACACLLLVSAWAVFPHGKSPAILPAVLDMYLLQPFFSLVMQLLSMAVFWLLRKAGDAPYDAPFSAVRFSAGVLMLLPAQLSYVFAPPPAI